MEVLFLQASLRAVRFDTLAATLFKRVKMKFGVWGVDGAVVFTLEFTDLFGSSLSLISLSLHYCVHL